MLAADRNAGGMNLREGWIGKKSSPFVGAMSGRDIAAASIRREKKYVSISAGREHHGVGRVPVDCSRAQAARDDSLGLSLHNH